MGSLALPVRPNHRTFSSASSLTSSPPTPLLVRSDSSDSAMNRTPSPVTPSFIDFNGLQPVKQDGAFPFSAQHLGDPSQAPYPQIPTHFTYPAPQAIAPQPALGQGPVQGPPSISDQASTSSKGPAKQQTKKNSYPWPLATRKSTRARRTPSAQSATRPLPARTTWSSTVAPTRTVATRRKVQVARAPLSDSAPQSAPAPALPQPRRP